jgi:hypothetical protein
LRPFSEVLLLPAALDGLRGFFFLTASVDEPGDEAEKEREDKRPFEVLSLLKDCMLCVRCIVMPLSDAVGVCELLESVDVHRVRPQPLQEGLDVSFGSGDLADLEGRKRLMAPRVRSWSVDMFFREKRDVWLWLWLDGSR